MTVLPIAVILVLLIAFRKPADVSGIAGWAATSFVAVFFFQTSSEVVVRSTFSGLLKSLPVSMVVASSLLQMAYMEKTGALRRILVFMKTIASENRAVQIMMINVGFGTLMVATGATPVSLLPPIMVALGYSTFAAIALPSIGYDSLCTYALLGAPVVVFVDMANGFLGKGNEITLSQAGMVFSTFLPVVSTMIGLCMLWIMGKWKAMREGLVPCLISGSVIGVVSYFTNRVDRLVVLTGVLSGTAVILAMAGFLLVTGKRVIDSSRLTPEERSVESAFPLWKAASPWIILIVMVLALNIPQGVFNFLYRDMTMPVYGISADGKPVVTRALWNAYTWIFASIFVSMLFLKPDRTQVMDALKLWRKRAPRPVFAAAIFFAIGEIMNMSGFSMAKGAFATDSMVTVLASSSSQLFSSAYGSLVAFIGLLGGFITGSEASTIAMFSNYTMKTARVLGMDLHKLLVVSAGLAFGGGLASVISPAKLQNAAAAIDKMGEETAVIKTAFALALLLTLATSIIVLAELAAG